MAFVKVVPRQTRAAGVHRSAARTLAAGRTVTMRLDAPWTGGDDLCLYGLEQSLDGGQTWSHWISAVTYGGARDRFNGLPSVTRKNESENPIEVRALIILAQPTEMGLEVEVTTG